MYHGASYKTRRMNRERALNILDDEAKLKAEREKRKADRMLRLNIEAHRKAKAKSAKEDKNGNSDE